MRKGMVYLGLSLAALAAAAPVRAGVGGASGALAAAAYEQPRTSDRVGQVALGPGPRTITDIPWLSLRQPGDRSLTRPRTAVPGAAPSPTELTAQVPAPPSGLALGLSALASLGAYRAGRSLRKLHIGTLPDWYHFGGAPQIGHATPFDLEFSVPPICAFASPAAPPPLVKRFWNVGWILRAQCTPPAAVPRGPPASSCAPVMVS